MEHHDTHPTTSGTGSHGRTYRLPRPDRTWLPHPGNILFTLLAIFVLLGAQSVGAIPSILPSASALPSRGMISYQGQLTDSNNQPLNGSYRMRFALYPAADAPTPLWQEEWSDAKAIQVTDGQFNVLLGSQNPITPGAIAGVDTLFLGVQVGLDDEMQPRLQLGGSPFAIQASQALTVPDGSIGTAQLANGAVSNAKLAADAVNGLNLAPTGFGAHNGPLMTFVPIPKTSLSVGGNNMGSRNWTNVTMPATIPPGAVAVLLFGYAGDTNATTQYTEIRFDAGGAPNDGVYGVVPQGPHSEINQAIVPLDGARRIAYKVTASGTNTFSTGWKIVGYWAPAHR
jgi:hypothetical protein